MKHSLALFSLAFGIVCASSLAQAPVPVAPAPAPIKLPSTRPSPSPRAMLEQLQTMRDANAKLLEQQAKTLTELEAMEKTSQSIKMLGKRS
jgi:hypothetical protein